MRQKSQGTTTDFVAVLGGLNTAEIQELILEFPGDSSSVDDFKR